MNVLRFVLRLLKVKIVAVTELVTVVYANVNLSGVYSKIVHVLLVVLIIVTETVSVAVMDNVFVALDSMGKDAKTDFLVKEIVLTVLLTKLPEDVHGVLLTEVVFTQLRFGSLSVDQTN